MKPRRRPEQDHADHRSRVPLAAAWTAAGVVLAMRLVVLPWPYLDASLSDFSAYWGAAVEIVHGRSPYTHITYVYPPLLALLLTPLGLVPYVAARRLFFGLSVLMMVATAALLSQGQRGWARLWPFLALAVAGGVSENLVLGQAQPLLMLLVTAAYLAAQRDRRTHEGGALGLASAIKLWPAVFLVAPAAGRRWRTLVAATLAAGVGLALVPAVRLLPGPSAPPATDYVFGTPAVLNGSLGGLAMRCASLPALTAPPPETWYRVGGALQTLNLSSAERLLGLGGFLLALAAGLAALWAGGLLRREMSPERITLVWCGLLTVGLLAVPVSWNHYQLLQWLTLAAAVPVLWRHRRAAAVAAGVGVMVASWAGPTVIAAAAHGGEWTAARAGTLLAASAVMPVAGILVLAALVAGARALDRAAVGAGPDVARSLTAADGARPRQR